MSGKRQRRGLWGLLLLFGFCTFFVHNTVLRPDLMEVRNLVTAHEMVSDGHWMVPTMNGAYRLEKPPLPTWVSACVELLFGDSLAIQRATAGVMGLLLTFFLYLLVKRLTGRRDTSLVAALMLMTCYNIILQGRTVTWDIYCHAFMMGAVYFLACMMPSPDGDCRSVRRAWLYAALFMGLSFMSKGPVAFLAVLLPALIAFLLFRATRPRLRWPQLLAMVGIVVVMAAWWYVYVYLEAPEATRSIIHKESASWVNHNVRPWWYYWRFFLESGVWAPLLLYVLYRSVRGWRNESLTTRVALVWTLSGVVLLSLLPEKKMRYLMPLMMPCCMLMADWVCRHWQRRTVVRLVTAVCVLFALVECAGLPLLNRILGYENRRSLAEVRPTLAGQPDVRVVYLEDADRHFRIDMTYYVRHHVAKAELAKADSLLEADAGRPLLLLVPAETTARSLGIDRPVTDLGVFDDNPYASNDMHYNLSLVSRALFVEPTKH